MVENWEDAFRYFKHDSKRFFLDTNTVFSYMNRLFKNSRTMHQKIIKKALKSVAICDIILLCYNINRLQPEYIATKLRRGKICTQKGQIPENRFCYC